jgi:hypothetical protein
MHKVAASLLGVAAGFVMVCSAQAASFTAVSASATPEVTAYGDRLRPMPDAQEQLAGTTGTILPVQYYYGYGNPYYPPYRPPPYAYYYPRRGYYPYPYYHRPYYRPYYHHHGFYRRY